MFIARVKSDKPYYFPVVQVRVFNRVLYSGRNIFCTSGIALGWQEPYFIIQFNICSGRDSPWNYSYLLINTQSDVKPIVPSSQGDVSRYTWRFFIYSRGGAYNSLNNRQSRRMMLHWKYKIYSFISPRTFQELSERYRQRKGSLLTIGPILGDDHLLPRINLSLILPLFLLSLLLSERLKTMTRLELARIPPPPPPLSHPPTIFLPPPTCRVLMKSLVD